MTKAKKVNSIVYCKKFSIASDLPESLYKQPEAGRVYEAHHDTINDEFVLRVRDESNQRTYSYLFIGVNGATEAFEYEFDIIKKDNIDTLSIHEEDLSIIESFISNKSIEDISMNDDAMPIEYMDIDDEKTDKLIKTIMSYSRESSNRLEKSVNSMNILISADPVFASAVQDLIIYLADFYSIESPVDMSRFVMSEHGKSFIMGSCLDKIAKYLSTRAGGDKEDLYSIIQLCLFELARLSNFNQQ